jgi:putative transposase
VLTEIRPVEIEVPRDRDGSFAPTIVGKRQRRSDGVDEIVLSLTARGLTTGEIAAHFAPGVRRDSQPRHHQPDHQQGRLGR